MRYNSSVQFVTQVLTLTGGHYAATETTGSASPCIIEKIGITENYAAVSAGFEPDIRIKVRSAEYSGQSYFVLGGERYRVIRTQSENAFFTVLVGEAGKGNFAITTQDTTVTYDSTGQPVITWVDHHQTWAEVLTSGGGEYYEAKKLYAQTDAVFKCLYIPGITAKERIKWGSRYFEILNVNDVRGAGDTLLLTAKEVI